MGNFNRLPWTLALLLVVAVLSVLLVKCPDDKPAVSVVGDGSGDETQAAALLRGNASAPDQNAAPPNNADASKQTTTEQSGAVPEGHSPPRTLEVQFFVGDEPLSRGVVLLWRHVPKVPMQLDRSTDYQQQLDESGVVRFVDLRHDAWTPGLQFDGGIRTFGPQVVLDHSPNRRVVIRMGTGTAIGTVYADNGEPAEGATLSLVQRAGSTRGETQVRTDGMGRYRLPYQGDRISTVYMRLPSVRPENRGYHAYRKKVWARPNEIVETNWGTPEGRPLMAGQVVCEDGEPVRGPGTILLWLDRQRASTYLRYDTDGKFHRRVDANRYQVTVGTPDSAGQRNKMDLDLRSDKTDMRLTIAGVRVVGRAAYADGTPLPSKSRLSIVMPAVSSRRHIRTASVHQGRFRFYGLPHGSHQIRFMSGQSGWVDVSTVVVGGGVAEVRHDVVVPRK